MAKRLANILRGKRPPSKRTSTVIAYFESNDAAACAEAKRLIVEGRDIPIDKRYSARYDRSMVPGMQDHLHIQFKGKDVCIVNRDGTPSHGTNLSAAPRYVYDYLRNKDWITEATAARKFGLPASVIRSAVEWFRSAALVQKLLSSKNNKRRP